MWLVGLQCPWTGFPDQVVFKGLSCFDNILSSHHCMEWLKYQSHTLALQEQRALNKLHIVYALFPSHSDSCIFCQLCDSDKCEPNRTEIEKSIPFSNVIQRYWNQIL